LQLIEKLLKDHEENGWLINQRALALITDERHADARDSLVAYLRKFPDHPLSNGLLALVMTDLEPIEQCKKVIHRAFLKSMTAEPYVVSVLAGKLVDHFLVTGKEMAARQHMAVLLRLESEQQRQKTLMVMLEFDSDTSVPYPLRGAHPLPQYSPGDAVAAQVKKAQRLYFHACFSEAADLLDQVSEQEPHSAELWHTIGLMRAWDGDEVRAAAALHRAAELYQVQERAIDVETIAQLLQRRGADVIKNKSRSYTTESLSRLLTRLDNDDRLNRTELLDEEFKRGGIVAAYDVLDRSVPTAAELEQATLETLPRAIGQIMLTDSEAAGSPASLAVTGLEGDRFENAVKILQEAAGDIIKPKVGEDGQAIADDEWGEYSSEELALSETAFFPPQTPPRVRNDLRTKFIHETVPQVWLETPLVGLGGKSPKQVAGDPAVVVALSAALRVFDSFFDRRGVILDQASLRQQLQLPVEEPITLTEDQDLNTLSVPQLLKLETSSLSDEVFDRVLQRCVVVKHAGLGCRLLAEYVTNRPKLVEVRAQDAEQAYVTLSDLCSRSLLHEEALKWLHQGSQFTKEHGNAFESLLMWKLREISLRSRNPEDPELRPLLLEVWNQYGAKLPAVRARLEEFTQTLKIDPPWGSSILAPQTVGIGEKPIWGAATEETSSAEKKLWVPD